MFKNVDVTNIGQYLLYVVITVGGGYLVATGHLTAADLAFMIGGLGTGHGVATSVATKSSAKTLSAAQLASIQEAVQQNLAASLRQQTGAMPIG